MTLSNLGKLGYTGDMPAVGSTPTSRAIARDIELNPEMPQFSTSYLSSLAQPKVSTVAPMGVNVPSTGIQTIDVDLPGNDLMAEITQADIDRFKQPMTQMMDYDTYRSINTDSTVTPEEFAQLKAQV